MSSRRWVVWAIAAAAIAAGGAAAAWLLMRQGGGTAESLLRYAPPDSTVVVCLDLGRLRQSSLYQQMKEKLAPAEERMVGDMRGLRLKPEDVEAALAAGSPESGVVALAMARPMALDELLEAPEQVKKEVIEGYAVAAARGKREPWVARVSDRVFCMSERGDVLRKVLQRVRSGEGPKLDAELDELLGPLRRQEHFFGFSGLAGSLGKVELLLPPPVVSQLAGLRALGVGFSVGSRIDLEARARLKHADQAMRLCGEVQKGVREGIARAESARPNLQGEKLEAADTALALLRSITASQADTLVCLRARLDEKATSSLVDPLVAGVARAQGQAQLAANMHKLHQIGLACISHEIQNAKWPKGLAELVDAGLLADKAMLVSPLDKEPPLLAPGLPCSYGTSLGKLGEQPRDIAHLPLAWDRVEFVPGKRCVLFFDGHVETVPDARFTALMRQVDGAAGVERPLPPTPKRPELPFLRRPEPPLPAPKSPKHADTELVGGPRGAPFRLTSRAAEPMLGVRCIVRKWMREECLGSVEPLFAAAPAGPMAAVAKPGYAVGAIEVDATAFVNAARVVFMRLEGGKLNPADSYRSEWLGKPTGRPPRLLDGKGAKVVGLCGRRGLVVNALGLVTEAEPTP